MNVNPKYLHSEITSILLQAFYTVIKELPNGLNLNVYKNALRIECQFLGLNAVLDKEIEIKYRKETVGKTLIDILIENLVIVKLISDENLIESATFDVKSQLKLTEFEVALVLNVGMEGQHKRIVYTNDLKVRTE